MVQDLERFLRRQVDETARRLRRMEAGFESSGRKLIALRSSKASTADAITRNVFNPGEWDKALMDVVRPHLARQLATGAATELALFKAARAQYQKRTAEETFQAFKIELPETVVRALADTLRELEQQPYWRDVNQTTLGQMSRAVEAGLNEGESLAQIAKRLRDVMGPAANQARAVRIARTETTGSLNAGQHAVRTELQREGLIEGRQWLAILDDDVRPEHSALAGVTAKQDEGFNVGGTEAPYPGWHGLPAAMRCNCRCTLVSVLAPIVDSGGERVSDLEQMPADQEQERREQEAREREEQAERERREAEERRLREEQDARRREEERQRREQEERERAERERQEQERREREQAAASRPIRRNKLILERNRTAEDAVRVAEDPRTQERMELVERLLKENHDALEQKRLAIAEIAQRFRAERRQDNVAMNKVRTEITKLNKAINEAGSDEERTELLNRLGSLSSQKRELENKQKDRLLNQAMAIADAINPGETVGVSFTITDEIKKQHNRVQTRVSELQQWVGKAVSGKHARNGVYGDNESNFGIAVDYARKLKGRAYHDKDEKSINFGTDDDFPVFVHEFGHALDEYGDVNELTKGFLAKRVGKERPRTMNEIEGTTVYDNGEIGRPGTFAPAFDGDVGKAAYTGSHYVGSTEVLSMGLEQLVRRPDVIVEKDPEYTRFVIGILDGSLLP